MKNPGSAMPAVSSLVRCLLLGTTFMFLFLGKSGGQSACGAEVKLLLAPQEAEMAVKALRAGKPASGRVFLYDTAALDLFSHGIILRVRQGSTSDLTVKVRLTEAPAVANATGNTGHFKCEVDQAGNTTAYSYSVRENLTAAPPTKGPELFRLLSESQLQLLKQTDFAIDWSQVKLVADLRSTAWAIKGQAPFENLDMELWQWPNGAVLELSTKSDAASLSATYEDLRSVATSKGLTPYGNQQFKTTLVLKKTSP